MQKQYIQATVTLPLRDYAAFEDLLDGAGVLLTDVRIATPTPENTPALPPVTIESTERRKYRRSRRVTNYDRDRLRAYVEENPTTTQMEAARALSLPFGRATMSRIFGELGLRDR
jgi:hypothetical protein